MKRQQKGIKWELAAAALRSLHANIEEGRERRERGRGEWGSGRVGEWEN